MADSRSANGSDFANTLGGLIADWGRSKRWWPLVAGQEAALDLLLPLSPASLESEDKSGAWIALLKSEDPVTTVQVPLLIFGDNDLAASTDSPQAIIGRWQDKLVLDGTGQPAFWQAWLNHAEVLSAPDRSKEEAQEFLSEAVTEVRPLAVEQSNTSVLLLGADRALIAKVFRVLHPGLHPEVEIPSALGGWEGTPKLWAYLTVRLDDSDSPSRACSSVVSDAIENTGDGFVVLREMAHTNRDASATAFQMGSLIAQMHNRLERQLGTVQGPSDAELRSRLESALATTVATSDSLSLEDVSQIRTLIEEITAGDGTVKPNEPESRAIRVHGDLHLGQLLRDKGGRWYVIDFEGEPLRDLEERRLPDSPARDIAGMLRSFDYAASSDGISEPAWLETARSAFLSGYKSSREISAKDMLTVRAYELDKALYELQYESQFRPQWVRIPVAALARLVSTRPSEG